MSTFFIEFIFEMLSNSCVWSLSWWRVVGIWRLCQSKWRSSNRKRSKRKFMVNMGENLLWWELDHWKVSQGKWLKSHLLNHWKLNCAEHWGMHNSRKQSCTGHRTWNRRLKSSTLLTSVNHIFPSGGKLCGKYYHLAVPLISPHLPLGWAGLQNKTGLQSLCWA